MRVRGIRLVLWFFPSILFAQRSPVNLDFKSGEPGRSPPGWSITQTASRAGESAELKRDGCKTGFCAVASRNLLQEFYAGPYRNHTVVLGSWIRIEAGEPGACARLRIQIEDVYGRRTFFDSLDQGAWRSPEWKRQEAAAHIGPEARSITIGVALKGKGHVWIDQVSLADLPASSEPEANIIPEPVRAGYARTDSNYNTGASQDLKALLLAPGNAGHENAHLPFESRIDGLARLAMKSVEWNAQTSVTEVRGRSQDYLDILARTRLRRKSAQREYVYELTYRDIWVRTGDGWRLRDSPPVAVRNVTPGRAEGPRLKRSASSRLCGLTSGMRFGLGLTDYNDALAPSGSLRAVMIFVDFPDVPATESADALYQQLAPYSQSWMREVSHGAASLDFTPVASWNRLPKPTADYHLEGMSAAQHRIFIGDALASIKDPRVDLSRYQIVYIVACRIPGAFGTGTLNAPPGTGVVFHGHEFRNVITFGNDIRYPAPDYAAHVLLHETAHLFGLPDLYEHGAPEIRRAVGGWDLMSSVTQASHFTAWEQAKLGWISGDQLRCVQEDTVTDVLSPIETAAGLKALVVPVSPSRAVVVEARELIGSDVSLCDEGLLVYTVDTLIPGDRGPMHVLGGSRGVSNDAMRKCGPAYDATLALGPGKASSLQDPESGVSVELLASSLGEYRVRVARRRDGSR